MHMKLSGIEVAFFVSIGDFIANTIVNLIAEKTAWINLFTIFMVFFTFFHTI